MESNVTSGQDDTGAVGALAAGGTAASAAESLRWQESPRRAVDQAVEPARAGWKPRSTTALSSLGSIPPNGHSRSALTCGNRQGMRVVDLLSGEHWPAACSLLSCDFCRPHMAKRRALAMAYAEPERAISITKLADADSDDPLSTARIRIKRARQYLKRKGVEPGEWAWTVERNPRGTGFHMHCVQRGDYIAQSTLQSACEAAGAGIPDIRRIRRAPGKLAQYGLKAFAAASYGAKTFHDPLIAKDALAINHGRLEHHTRNFYRIHGREYAVRQAESVAHALEYGAKTRLMLVVSADEAARLADSLPGREALKSYLTGRRYQR